MAHNLKIIQYVFFMAIVLTIAVVWVLDHSKNISLIPAIISTSLEPGSKAWYLRRAKTKDEIAQYYNSFFSTQVNHDEPGKNIHIELTAGRINRLLLIAQEAEPKFRDQLEYLEVMMIDRVLARYGQDPLYFKQYEYEFNTFTLRHGKRLIVNDKFATMLGKRSDYFTFANPNKDLAKVPLKKPIKLLTATNEKYFGFLCNALNRLINVNLFPEIVYVYDLGMSEESNKKLIRDFSGRLNLVVRKFFDIKIIHDKYKHFAANIKNYAWKPIIIQEIFKTLEEDETFIYIDTAVVVRNNLIQQLVHYSQATGGFYIPIIYFNFTCYANPKTFDWFQEDVKNFVQMGSHLHAAFIILTKNFVTTMIMKSWVTCALDKDCIEPEGARLEPCCGCHRYDQTALQIIISHFFTYPTNYRTFYPAYGSFFQGHDLYHFLAERP